MKDFFRDILNRMVILTGKNQLEKLYELCGQQEQEYRAMLDDLLTELDNACLRFPYIPDNEKKKIIYEALVTDKDFYSLNKAIVIKWLEQKKGLYFRESHHVNDNVLTEKDRTPLEGEARQAYIQQLIDMTRNNYVRDVPKLTVREIEQEGQTEPRKPTYQKPPDEVILKKEALRKAATKFYNGKVVDLHHFRYFTVENMEVFAANLEDAQQIYIDALVLVEEKTKEK